MSRILVDAEKGVVALIHEIEHAPTDASTIPDTGLRTAASMAARLGLDVGGLAAPEIGWLFDLAGHAIDALTDARSEGAQDAQEPANAQTEAIAPADAQEPSAANREAVAPVSSGAEGPTAATSPSVEGDTPPQQPADTDVDASHQAQIDEAIAKAQQEWGETKAGE